MESFVELYLFCNQRGWKSLTFFGVVVVGFGVVVVVVEVVVVGGALKSTETV